MTASPGKCVCIQSLIDPLRRVSRLPQLSNTDREAAQIKDDKSPVTIVDLSIQAIVSHILREKYASIPIVSEEDDCPADILSKVTSICNEFLNLKEDESYWSKFFFASSSTAHSGTFFTLDPIDGTKGFLRRPAGQFAVALSYFEDYKVKMSVIAAPVLPYPSLTSSKIGSLFYATADNGSYQTSLFDEDAPIRLNMPSTVSGRMPASIQGAERSHAGLNEFDIFRKMLYPDEEVKVYVYDSMIKYCLMARGEVDFRVKFPKDKLNPYIEKIWDIAPGQLILEEAGGELLDLNGKKMDYTTGVHMSNNLGLAMCHADNMERMQSKLKLFLKQEKR